MKQGLRVPRRQLIIETIEYQVACGEDLSDIFESALNRLSYYKDAQADCYERNDEEAIERYQYKIDGIIMELDYLKSL